MLKYEARMAPHADQSTFGWLVTIAALLAAVPFVLTFQHHAPEPMIWIGCLAGAGAIGGMAMHRRGGALHDVRLENEAAELRFVVRGPSLSLDVRGGLSARAFLGEIAPRAGSRALVVLTRVLIVEHRGKPVVVLEEAVQPGAPGHEHWPDAGDGDLDAPGVPSLMKSLVPPDLEKLRRAFASR